MKENSIWLAEEFRLRCSLLQQLKTGPQLALSLGQFVGRLTNGQQPSSNCSRTLELTFLPQAALILSPMEPEDEDTKAWPLEHKSVDEQQRERDAILALGSMRQSSNQPQPQSSSFSNPTAPLDSSQELSRRSSSVFTTFDAASPWTSTTSLHSPDASVLDLSAPDAKFLDRVSRLPYISSARRAYELGRNSSRVVKVSRHVKFLPLTPLSCFCSPGPQTLMPFLSICQYGTDLMESSVSALSNKVVGQRRMERLDGFACRQLNRISPSTRQTQLPLEEDDRGAFNIQDEGVSEDLSASFARKRKRRPSQAMADDELVPPEQVLAAEALAAQEASSSDSNPSSQHSTAARRRWQSMLVEAGGLSAAVSEDSLKSLQFCLSWLGYTTATLQDRIAFLRSFMLSLSDSPHSQSNIDPAHIEALQRVKTELVDTVKNAVDVLSRHAGGALPHQARTFVRGTILALPARFNHFVQHQHQRGSSAGDERQALHDAAERMLTFAVEGCETLGSVAQVFGQTVERADSCVLS